MGNINRQIITTFSARGGSQVRATMGEITGGLNAMMRQQQAAGRSTGYLNTQMRAMGTTARYALAGAAIFGSASLVSRLSQVQQQLGLISAISPTAFNGVALAGQQLTDFGESAEDAAYRALTPIAEFNDGLINLVSTVQGVPQDQIVPILEQIAKVSVTAQTPVEELTKGISSMMVAFNDPVNLKNAQKYLAQYQAVINNVPGGISAGPQIIAQLPQLSSVSRRANVSPDQLFGLVETSLRSSGNPATAIRGLQYLLDTIASGGVSSKAKKNLRSIGVTSEFVQQKGGVEALFRIIQAVKSKGVGGNVSGLKGLSEEYLTGLEGSTGGDQLRGLGISGKGAEFAQVSTGRIHATRALISLLSRDKKAMQDLEAMVELGRSHDAQIAQLHQSWKRFSDRAQLRKASIAVDQMGLDIVQAFEPLLNQLAPALGGLRDVVDGHSNEVAYGLAGGLAATAAVRRLRGRGGGGLIRGVGAVGAAQDAVSGSQERGYTPQNPLYVAVVYSMGGKDGPGIPPVIAKGGKLGGRIRSIGGKALKGGGAFAAAIAATDLVDEYIYDMGFDPSLKNAPGNLAKIRDALSLKSDPKKAAARKRVSSDLKSHYISPKTAEDRFLAIAQDRFDVKRNRVRVEGTVRANLTLNLKHKDGTVEKKRVSVTADLVPRFRSGSRPQSKGKDRTYRGGD